MAYGVAVAAALASTTALSSPAAHAAPTTLVVTNPIAFTPPDNLVSGLSRQVTVVGQTGLVTDLDVTLNAFTSTYPEDLDLLLVGPNGRSVMLMSDACADIDVSNLTIRIDDEAAGPPTDAGPCVSGSYVPFNTDEDDDNRPTSPALSAFDGISPNGTWTLFGADDGANDATTFGGGFTLTFQVSDKVLPTVTFKKPKPSTAAIQKVSFTADDAGSTFECNLDGVGWNACKSPAKLKHLGVGKHKLSVRATDPSGNRGAPAKVTVRVLPRG
jgi:subtilisin-like proprotein convertase family protein